VTQSRYRIYGKEKKSLHFPEIKRVSSMKDPFSAFEALWLIIFRGKDLHLVLRVDFKAVW
jgi:hypothetical protein